MDGIHKQVYVENQVKFTKTYDKAGQHDMERDKGTRNWDRDGQNRRRVEDSSESRCVHRVDLSAFLSARCVALFP